MKNDLCKLVQTNLAVVFGGPATIFRPMKRGSIVRTLVALFVVGFALAASAELKENPYQIIIDRNPFKLSPPPPPPTPTVTETNPPAPPPPDIKLTGITTLLGAPRVMLQVEDKQSKKFLFPTLEEGETANGITIVAIDAENMKVRVKNGDAETTLDFKNNGVKPGAGAVAATTPAPQHGLMPLGAAPAHPAAAAAAAAAAANQSRGAIVAGGVPAPTTTPAVNYAATPGSVPGASSVGALGAGGIPPRPVRTDGAIIGGGAGGNVYNPNAPRIPTQQPAMSREEAEARIELARQQLKAQQEAGQLKLGQPTPNILPPTGLGRALNQPQNTPAPGQPLR